MKKSLFIPDVVLQEDKDYRLARRGSDKESTTFQ